MSDIVDRLRTRNGRPDGFGLGSVCDEAADIIERLRTVMVAAAEEIAAHWDAHCDAEGYGPANLQRRLEEGIPSQYGYTAGAFAELKAENERLRAAIAAPQPAPARPDMMLVPRWLLQAASDSLGSFVSDHGWAQEDMDIMDSLDAYLASQPAAPGAPDAQKGAQP